MACSFHLEISSFCHLIGYLPTSLAAPFSEPSTHPPFNMDYFQELTAREQTMAKEIGNALLIIGYKKILASDLHTSLTLLLTLREASCHVTSYPRKRLMCQGLRAVSCQ